MCRAIEQDTTALAGVEEMLLQAFADIHPKLLRKLYALLGNDADAHDALQTAFLHCWRARVAAPHTGNLRGWIWRVGVNAGRDLRKYLRLRRTLPLTESADRSAEYDGLPAQAVLRQEEQEQLREALAQLRPAERAVFRLRYEEALPFAEVARRCGCPLGTAKPLMRQALRKLRGLVGSVESTDSV